MIKKMLLYFFSTVLFLSAIPSLSSASSGEEPYFQNTNLYVSGTEGYHTFRIPSLLTLKAGTVLAFAEGRKNSASDTGNIDVVLKRSFDQGQTWQPMQVVCDVGVDTCGNPTAVQDESTGRIWLFLTQNYGEDTIEKINNGTSRGVRTIWSTYSDDEGATWSPLVNRFNEVQNPATRWDATGPGIGIQLQHGPAQGRLVIPAISRNIQSDDHGVTWYESGRLPDGLNEATVVELSDGTLMRNDRISTNQQMKRRGISTSADQGATWSPIVYDDELIDPICEASIIRNGDGMLLFANPANTERRDNMTVRVSNDDGRSWTTQKTVYKGNAAYSSLTILPNGKAGLLFEGGAYTAYDKIMFAVFNQEWFSVREADLDNLQFSDGSLTPVFRGDQTEYVLGVYNGTAQLTLTPVTSNKNISITVNGEPATAGIAKPILLNGLSDISVEAKLGERVRHYTIHLDQTKAKPELLVHWNFDQTNEQGIQDLTGKGHTGLLKNGAELMPGLDGNSLYLNGLRANVEITNTADLNPGTDDFSFSVWVNPDSLFQQRHILYWYGVAGAKLPQWWFSVEKNGAVRINMTGVPSGKEVGVATAAGLVRPGEWTHITVVREGSVNKIYVKGELAATSVQYDPTTMDLTNLSSPPLVGFDKGTVANRDWKGYLDDLKIYKYAMNEADVRKHYWNGVDKVAPVTQADVVPAAPNGVNGWYTSDVKVSLSTSDDLSGVARTEYRLNGGEWKTYSGGVTVTNEGATVLEYRSVDRAGNVEAAHSQTFHIDKSAPTLNVVPDQTVLWPPNGKMTPITVDVQSSDVGSGVAEIKLVSITSNEESMEDDIHNAQFGTDDRSFSLRASRNGNGSGRIYTIRYQVTDQAGQITTATAEVQVQHDQSK